MRVTKIHGLGEEAYTLGDSPYGRKGAGTLVARRGHVLLRLDTSSHEAAKRFAKHMLGEVDVK